MEEGRRRILGFRLADSSETLDEIDHDLLEALPPQGGRGVYRRWRSFKSWALAEHKAFRPVPFLTLLYNPALQCHSGDVIHLAVGNHLKDGC